MPEPVMTYLTSMSINLIGMLLIYALMAHALVRRHWHQRGTLGVLVTIVMAEFFWIGPAHVGRYFSSSETSMSYGLCFGNWLVSAFAVVLLGKVASRISRALEDTARMDGVSWFGIHWHIVLPSVARDLAALGLLTVMATALPFAVNLYPPGGTGVQPPLGFTSLFAHASLASTFGLSALLSLPVFVIFFLFTREIRTRSAPAS